MIESVDNNPAGKTKMIEIPRVVDAYLTHVIDQASTLIIIVQIVQIKVVQIIV